jgi:hypothetical protein
MGDLLNEGGIVNITRIRRRQGPRFADIFLGLR